MDTPKAVYSYDYRVVAALPQQASLQSEELAHPNRTNHRPQSLAWQMAGSNCFETMHQVLIFITPAKSVGMTSSATLVQLLSPSESE